MWSAVTTLSRRPPPAPQPQPAPTPTHTHTHTHTHGHTGAHTCTPTHPHTHTLDTRTHTRPRPARPAADVVVKRRGLLYDSASDLGDTHRLVTAGWTLAAAAGALISGQAKGGGVWESAPMVRAACLCRLVTTDLEGAEGSAADLSVRMFEPVSVWACGHEPRTRALAPAPAPALKFTLPLPLTPTERVVPQGSLRTAVRAVSECEPYEPGHAGVAATGSRQQRPRAQDLGRGQGGWKVTE